MLVRVEISCVQDVSVASRLHFGQMKVYVLPVVPLGDSGKPIGFQEVAL
jgi:hypothetical protein